MPPKVAVHSPDSTPMSQLLVACGEWGAAGRGVNASRGRPRRRREVRGACKRRTFSPMWVPMTVEAAIASASDHRNARCVSLKPRATISGQTRKVKAEV